MAAVQNSGSLCLLVFGGSVCGRMAVLVAQSRALGWASCASRRARAPVANENILVSLSVTPGFFSSTAARKEPGPVTPAHARASPRSLVSFPDDPLGCPFRALLTALKVGPVCELSATPQSAPN